MTRLDAMQTSSADSNGHLNSNANAMIAAAPRIERLRFIFEADDAITLPVYPGSIWHGVFGKALRQVACIMAQDRCDGCPLIDDCVYARIFDSPKNPYVLNVPHKDPHCRKTDDRHEVDWCEAGDRFELGMGLLSSRIQHLPLLIHAFNVAGRHGIGHRRGHFGLIAVAREMQLGANTWETLYQAGAVYRRPAEPAQILLPKPPTVVNVVMKTRVRIDLDDGLVSAARLDAPIFLRALAARLGFLCNYTEEGDASVFVWKNLAHQAETIAMTDVDVQWVDWTRYSARTRQPMKFGGLVGSMTLAGPGLEQLWPLLWLGQWFHVGKRSTFGLGEYVVEPG